MLWHMEITIDPASPVPGYRQLADHLRQQIGTGDITSRLPSYTELCDASGLSLPSVQHAVRVLRDEGLVDSVKGRGTFVTRRKLLCNSPYGRDREPRHR
jgi:GntR family transcriptional regulator